MKRKAGYIGQVGHHHQRVHLFKELGPKTPGQDPDHQVDYEHKFGVALCGKDSRKWMSRVLAWVWDGRREHYICKDCLRVLDRQEKESG